MTAAATEAPRPEARRPIPDPEPLDLLPVDWVVVTPDTLPSGDYVFFALTPQQYENASRNRAELIRWIREAAWRLEYYKNDGEPRPADDNPN